MQKRITLVVRSLDRSENTPLFSGGGKSVNGFRVGCPRVVKDMLVIAATPFNKRTKGLYSSQGVDGTWN